MIKEDDVGSVQSGTAVLIAALVETMNDGDPTFKERFLKNLTHAYCKERDSSRFDSAKNLEMFRWTRTLLTGFSHIDGQGDPFFADR